MYSLSHSRYNLVIKIPGIETTLITIMERRFKLRAASMLMEEQEQFRDTVVQLKYSPPPT